MNPSNAENYAFGHEMERVTVNDMLGVRNSSGSCYIGNCSKFSCENAAVVPEKTIFDVKKPVESALGAFRFWNGVGENKSHTKLSWHRSEVSR